MLQLCRPLSGAVTSRTLISATAASAGFNCAAPFRERLPPRRTRSPKTDTWLQLCRPLSGAVTIEKIAGAALLTELQLCRPLSGAVTAPRSPYPHTAHRFNCAAPFRERLPFGNRLCFIPAFGLQLCRPLSGAVTGHPDTHPLGYHPLQLCRPLSGAVTAMPPVWNTALPVLQLCRPLSGAVTLLNQLGATIPLVGFNCAAPFRERLQPQCPLWLPAAQRLQLCRPLSGAVTGRQGSRPRQGGRASIVPPPFGSGYPSATGCALFPPSGFNCAAPFRERLQVILIRILSGITRFNCAAPFRERLPLCRRCGTLLYLCFNCAAPFRERLRC